MAMQLEMFELFGDYDQAKYSADVEERWGSTNAYRQSQQRIMCDTAAFNQGFIEMLRGGSPANDPRAAALVKEHKQQISGNSYDCSFESHRGLRSCALPPRVSRRPTRFCTGIGAQRFGNYHS